MKIIIDARLYSQSGVGRYTRKLLENLAKIDQKNRYIIFLKGEDFRKYQKLGKNFTPRKVEIGWHSLKEQLVLPFLIWREKADLVHFPYFSVPILTPGKFIVTIHDLIIDHYNTGRASTHSFWVYQLKRLFYKLILTIALRRSARIITVSKSTKEELISHYRLSSEKITVTYEASGLETKTTTQGPALVEGQYLLYVGNAYPHKNIKRLLKVFLNIQKKQPNLKLVLVGSKDYFYRKLEKKNDSKSIIFFGLAEDKQLLNLYQRAQAFVFPSLMEGFGLPPLEAMAFGCPVVTSGSSSIPEVCGPAALYFNPQNSPEIEKKIIRILQDKKLRQKLIQLGLKQVRKYDWKDTAKKTLEIYESSFGLRPGQ